MQPRKHEDTKPHEENQKFSSSCFPSWFRAFVVPAGVWLVACLAMAATHDGEEIAVVQAFRPAVSGGPEGPHYIRSDFSTGSDGLRDT